jgi:3-phosphoshikimate 1-carboxyvinyltransferase
LVDVVVRRSERFGGEIYAPPSKAYTHRMTITALLSSGVSKILNPLRSDDTQATLKATEAFGAETNLEQNCWTIKGTTQLKTPDSPIDCGESGATLRFMIPIAALAAGSSTFTLGESLRRRPLEPLLQSLKQLGAESSLQLSEKTATVKVHGGGIKGGETSIRGDVSSQFISGLLFACPRAEEDTEINVTTPLESRNYVEMTMEVLDKHNVKVFTSKDFRKLRVLCSQSYVPRCHEVPGDFSSAAFLLAAAAITSSRVKVKNLNRHTKQGDKAILNILGKMGSKVTVKNGYVDVEGKPLTAVDVDAKDIPDLVPVCASLACYSKGVTKLYNARRLRYKESDRLSSLYTELKKMGADITIVEDGLIISGPCLLQGATINPRDDHRIAMACAIAALDASGETIIQDSECVKKSYPNFFDDLQLLGADVLGR